jgi:hypothetical protein
LSQEILFFPLLIVSSPGLLNSVIPGGFLDWVCIGTRYFKCLSPATYRSVFVLVQSFRWGRFLASDFFYALFMLFFFIFSYLSALFCLYIVFSLCFGYSPLFLLLISPTLSLRPEKPVNDYPFYIRYVTLPVAILLCWLFFSSRKLTLETPFFLLIALN